MKGITRHWLGSLLVLATTFVTQQSAGAQSCVPCGQDYNSPNGLRCVDRDGQGTCEELYRDIGIGPTENASNCWQCPHDAPFTLFGPGEYAGPARSQQIGEYRLRAGDTVQFLFLLTELKTRGAYRLVVGDELLIESEADVELRRGDLERGLKVQPDGTITLRLIGQVYAAGQTVDQLRETLNEKYTEFYEEPAIDVTPVNTGSKAIAIRNAISGAGGFDPQIATQVITPAGKLRLPKIGQVYAQGLTLDELKTEINLRYDAAVGGLEVEPSLQDQAPHQVFVTGEVATPGRFDLNDSPTTVIGALALAGGYVPGANLRQIVVFRRGEDWRLVSTVLDLRAPLLGRDSHPRDEIFVRDGDVIIVPSTPIRLFDNFVNQVFTQGIYGVFPLSAAYNFGSSFQ